MPQDLKEYYLSRKNNGQECEYLEELNKIIEKLFSNNEHARRVKESAEKLDVIKGRFNELRKILRLEDIGNIPREKLIIESDKEIGDIKNELKEFKTRLKKVIESDNPYDAKACGIILKYLDEHEDKLFRPSVMLTVDGVEIIIRFPRTNAEIEQFIGDIKSGAVKRTGKKNVGYVLHLFGPYIAIAKNLENDAYVKKLYGSVENMPNVFSKVSKEEFKKWEEKFEEDKVGYGANKRMKWEYINQIKEGVGAIIKKSNGVLPL